MITVFSLKEKKVIKVEEEIVFSSFSSFHLIVVTARAKGEKQLTEGSTDDEDLTATIDEKTFPKLGTTGDLIDSPASFSGGQLHGLAKTIYFLTFLKGRKHRIVLRAEEPPGTANLEELEVYGVGLDERFDLVVNQQAENGDRRPWLTFVLDNLPLKSFTPSITYYRRFRDSDDVKVISDGGVRTSLSRKFKHFFWFFVGSLIPKLSFKTERDKFLVDFPPKLHYLEFQADRTPTFHSLTLDFGVRPAVPQCVPTVESPKWTEDLYDDTQEIILARLIFGESRNRPKEEKVAVAWVVRNRLLVGNRDFGFSYHEIILKNDGVHYQFSPMNPRETDNFPLLIDPLKSGDIVTVLAWKESYEVASGVVSGRVVDPTDGAVFFHSKDLSKEGFLERVPRAVYLKEIGRFRFYGLRE